MRDEWYVARRGQGGNTRYGPVPLQELRTLLDQGKVKGEDLVWCEGMANWQRADQSDALFSPRPPRDNPRYARRGYGPDDDEDRPYRRPYPPPRQSSSGALTVLLVLGGVIGLCVLGCAGLGFIGYMNARSSATSFAPVVAPPVTVNPMPLPPNDGVIFGPGAPQNGLGQAIPYGASDLYSTNNVLPADAQALGDYLNGQGVFPIDHGVTVQLDKDPAGVYRARFCLKDGAAFDPDVFNYYRDLRGDIADNVFPNSIVVVELCDANMNTVRSIGAND